MMNASPRTASAGSPQRYSVACSGRHPLQASAELDLPTDPDEEDFDDDEEEDDDSDRLQFGLEAEWR
jgi:hypothetical protein